MGMGRKYVRQGWGIYEGMVARMGLMLGRRESQRWEGLSTEY